MQRKTKYLMTGVLASLLLVGCSQQHAETLESSDTVKVHTNSENTQTDSNGNATNSINSSAVSDHSQTTTQSSTSNGSTATNSSSSAEKQSGSIVNKLATDAIKQIESKKDIVLDDKYIIVVQSQTDDVIEINVRQKTKDEDVTTSYGYFKYTKSTNTLEQRSDENGEYETVM